MKKAALKTKYKDVKTEKKAMVMMMVWGRNLNICCDRRINANIFKGPFDESGK